MVAIQLDGNYIDAKCINSCKTNWKYSHVINVNWHVLDNKVPHELKSTIRSNGCIVELTLSHIH